MRVEKTSGVKSSLVEPRERPWRSGRKQGTDTEFRHHEYTPIASRLGAEFVSVRFFAAQPVEIWAETDS
jgi:hypothetical protein